MNLIIWRDMQQVFLKPECLWALWERTPKLFDVTKNPNLCPPHSLALTLSWYNRIVLFIHIIRFHHLIHLILSIFVHHSASSCSSFLMRFLEMARSPPNYVLAHAGSMFYSGGGAPQLAFILFCLVPIFISNNSISLMNKQKTMK
mmetsp:Transcript_8160/g.30213  ORF Transcript_8160/g.30213 Transcript_8160/m.30213 type:complete len:145 (-) Transcript_8160:34-468(-)